MAGHLLPHPIDIVAILLAIFLAMRKSETRGEDGRTLSGVRPATLEAWRTVALSAYTLGIRACFAKVVLDFLVAALFRSYPLPAPLRLAFGVSLDLAWVAAMLVVWSGARRAGKLWRSLELESAAAAAPPVESPESD